MASAPAGQRYGNTQHSAWGTPHRATLTWGRPEQGQVCRSPIASRDRPGPLGREDSSALNLGWGEKGPVPEKGTGRLPEPQMGDLPRNNSQDHRLAVLCRTGLDSHGARLETHEGHWAVGTWVRVGVHAGRTRALWCHILSAHKLHLSSEDVMRNVCPLLFPLELGSEHVYQSVITVSRGKLYP